MATIIARLITSKAWAENNGKIAVKSRALAKKFLYKHFLTLVF